MKRPFSKSRFATQAAFAVMGGITLVYMVTMNTGNVNLVKAVAAFLTNIKFMFLQPTINSDLPKLLVAVAVTVSLAILTTIMGALIAFFTGLLGARNLSTKRRSNTIRMVMAAIRAVPTILWVLIFAINSQLGATAAIIGLNFHSIAYLTKAYSEEFEAINPGTLEALRSTGASYWQIVFQAVLPSVIPTLLSWTFIRLEINFANAIAVGAAAGAGGIGYNLYLDGTYYFDFHAVGTIVYMLLVVILVFEFISMRLRTHYLQKN
ncbi:ABC transporter permease subunit [Periweissella cryptocerci]|uniref:ABC transporter permease subunit n=2 Tax=Periweissella cryptocerci TaxID=2506420 RepID=A0A4P6YX43_9LACO|nr:ABC transporter permease subunit [Periweissella cryptocerci]